MQQRYRTTVQLLALELREGRVEQGTMAHIPANVMIELDSTVPFRPEMVSIRWESGMYAIFRIDLEQKTVALQSPESETTLLPSPKADAS